MKEKFHKKVSELPTSLRPREKLMASGARKLTNADLIAILIGRGTPRQNALKIAFNILRKYKLEELPQLGLKEWQEIEGIGKAKACEFLALFELAQRLYGPEKEAVLVDSHEKILELVEDIKHAKREHLIGIYLDGQNRLVFKETLAIGNVNISYIHPKDILQPAFIHSASSFILVHNHPSGTLEPSEEDLKLTRRVKEVSEQLDIYLLDHVIVGPGGSLSLKKRELLP